MHSIKLLAGALLLISSSCVIAGDNSAPTALIATYCKEMLNGAFTSTEGINRVLKISVPEAAKRFCCGYDSALVIRSCEVIDKRISPSSASFQLRFKVLGALSGYQFQKAAVGEFLEEVTAVKSNAGIWQLEKFTDTPRQSLNSAIRLLAENRDAACGYPINDADDEPCPVDDELKKLRTLKKHR